MTAIHGSHPCVILGSGNIGTDLLAKLFRCEIDTFAAMDAAEETVRPIRDRVPFVSRSALLLGYAGVYGSFLLHAERAAKRFGCRRRRSSWRWGGARPSAARRT